MKAFLFLVVVLALVSPVYAQDHTSMSVCFSSACFDLNEIEPGVLYADYKLFHQIADARFVSVDGTIYSVGRLTSGYPTHGLAIFSNDRYPDSYDEFVYLYPARQVFMPVMINQ